MLEPQPTIPPPKPMPHADTALSCTVLNPFARAADAKWRAERAGMPATAIITIRPGCVTLRCAKGLYAKDVPHDPRSLIWHYQAVLGAVADFQQIADNEPLDLVVAPEQGLALVEHQQLEGLRMAYAPGGSLLIERSGTSAPPVPLPAPITQTLDRNPGWRLFGGPSQQRLDIFIEHGRMTANWKGRTAEAPLQSSETFRIARAEPAYHGMKRFRDELGLPNYAQVVVHEDSGALSELEWHILDNAAEVMRLRVVNGPAQSAALPDKPAPGWLSRSVIGTAAAVAAIWVVPWLVGLVAPALETASAVLVAVALIIRSIVVSARVWRNEKKKMEQRIEQVARETRQPM